MKHNKKATMGVYSIFVAVFTVFALSYALISLNQANKIQSSAVGIKQFAVFSSLQDASGVNIFLDQASDLSAQKAVEKMGVSCFNNPSTEHVVDEWVSNCGKYIYPMWSTNEELCLPDCETAFTNAFKDSFLGMVGNYFRATGIELPLSYNLTVDKKDDYFMFHGVSDSDVQLNILDQEARFWYPLTITMPYYGGKFTWPVQTGSKTLSSCFGPRIINGETEDHPGVDIPAERGTPVLAAAFGQVVVANRCNGRVVINHGSGISSEYLHMDSIIINVNDKVGEGQQIGTVGGRGDNCSEDAYPPHLHFAVIYKNAVSGLRFGEDTRYGTYKIVFKSYGTDDRVQPLCFLETPDSTLGEGCGTPINTNELDAVCKAYNLPMPSSSATYAGLNSLKDVYTKWGNYIRAASQRYGVSECQILSHIFQESSGNPYAISSVGAAGLMQLMPDTARGLGLTVPVCDWVHDKSSCSTDMDDRFNPELNVMAGTRYLTQLQDRINNYVCSGKNTNFAVDSIQVIAGYNWGPEHVRLCTSATEKWPDETQGYIEKVKQYQMTCEASNLISGNMITGNIPSEMPPGLEPSISASAPSTIVKSLGAYAFKPSFTVRVNKNLNDTIKPVSDWFRDTWENCTDNPGRCIDKKMKEFNSQPSDYKLSFASHCEQYPFFYDMVELIQDCFSNKTAGCICEFNFSKITSPDGKDMTIWFDVANNNVSLHVKTAKDGEEAYETRESYILHNARINSALPSHTYYIYFLNFNPDTHKLENARLGVFSLLDNSAADTYLFDDYKVMRILKTSPTEGIFTDDAATTNKCSYSKDKFRLCAYPYNSSRKDLITLRFGLQLKDEPPKPPESIVVTPITQDNGAQSSSIAEQVLAASILPIGGGFGLDLPSLIAESEKSAALQVAVKVPVDSDGSPKVAGYKVYCNDFLTEYFENQFLDDIIEQSQFAVIPYSNKGSNPLSKYITNSRSEFLSGTRCDVAVTKQSTGESVPVQGIKGVYKNGTMIFNINKCGGAAVLLDKFIRKDYCITLVPVDENGNEMKERAISTCTKTNSILDMVVGDLIKQELGSFLPSGLIPDSLQPYIKLPDSNQIYDAVTGRRNLNLVSMVNTENTDLLLKGILPEFISNVTNNQLTTSALINSMNGIDAWSKQEIFNAAANQIINGEITNEQTRDLLNKAISGTDLSEEASSMVLSQGVAFLNEQDSSKATAILKQTISSDNLESAAIDEIKRGAVEQLNSYEKREALLDAASSSSGSDVHEKIIEAAANKGYTGSDVNEAMALLRPDEVDALYRETLSDHQVSGTSKQGLLNNAVDRLGDRAPGLLQNVITQGNFNSIAHELVQSELKNMNSDVQSQFMTDILRGGVPGYEMLSTDFQSEIFKMIPDINSNMASSLLADGNINSLLGDLLRGALENEVSSFLEGECTPVTG